MTIAHLSPAPLPYGDPALHCQALCSAVLHDAVCPARDNAIGELHALIESCRRVTSRKHPPRVLIVEDDVSIADFMASLFATELGAQCVVVYDGAEALELLARDGEWSVVILDLRLPGENGVEVARAVDRSVPLAVMSGYWTDDTTAAADSLRVQWRVTKPVEYADLLRLVHEIGAVICPTA